METVILNPIEVTVVRMPRSKLPKFLVDLLNWKIRLFLPLLGLFLVMLLYVSIFPSLGGAITFVIVTTLLAFVIALSRLTNYRSSRVAKITINDIGLSLQTWKKSRFYIWDSIKAVGHHVNPEKKSYLFSDGLYIDMHASSFESVDDYRQTWEWISQKLHELDIERYGDTGREAFS